LTVEENEKLFEQKYSIISIIYAADFVYNRLRFKVVIDKSCRGNFSGHSVFM